MDDNINAVYNQETPVPKNTDMNDCDFLKDALTMEKTTSNDYGIALNEASNDILYEELKTLSNETKDMARNIFNLSFKKGWYKLEKAKNEKIDTVAEEYTGKLKELK